jgi:hypothetical protein
MGHLQPRSRPNTYRWQQVVDLLQGEGDVSAIASASMVAAGAGLQRIGDDPGFIHTLTAIFKLVEAASSSDFEQSLRNAGFQIPEKVSLFDITSSFRAKVDTDLNRSRSRSDAAEIAQNAFSETLVGHVMTDSPSLFSETAESVQRSLRSHLTGVRFKGLMHEFFSSVTSRYLSYYLSRELSNHVGPGERFSSLGAHSDFDRVFDTFVRQTVSIADEFTPGWFGKARYEQRLDYDSVSRYSHVAFKKIRGEFAREHERRR